MKHLVVSVCMVLVLCIQGSTQEPAKDSVKTVTYRKTKEADLALHLHFPPGWKAEDKRPAIVFFFGGGWTSGTVKQFEPQAAYLAGRGLVAARADYRVKARHGVTPDQCVGDARSAVRWLRQNAATLGIDPQRLIASGGSAGGHLAACTTLSDFAGDAEESQVSSKANALVLFNPVLRFQGVPQLMERIGKQEAVGKSLSPTLHLAKDSPPALILFGTNDKLLEQGEEFLKKAKELGQRTELFTAEGQPHGFFNKPPWRERTLQRVDEFLASLNYLSGKPTIKAP